MPDQRGHDRSPALRARARAEPRITFARVAICATALSRAHMLSDRTLQRFSKALVVHRLSRNSVALPFGTRDGTYLRCHDR